MLSAAVDFFLGVGRLFWGVRFFVVAMGAALYVVPRLKTFANSLYNLLQGDVPHNTHAGTASMSRSGVPAEEVRTKDTAQPPIR